MPPAPALPALPSDHALSKAPTPRASPASQLSDADTPSATFPSLTGLEAFSAIPTGSQRALFSKQLQRLQEEHEQRKVSQLQEYDVQENVLRSELQQLHSAEFGRLRAQLDELEISKVPLESCATLPSHGLGTDCVADLLLQSAPAVPFAAGIGNHTGTTLFGHLDVPRRPAVASSRQSYVYLNVNPLYHV